MFPSCVIYIWTKPTEVWEEEKQEHKDIKKWLKYDISQLSGLQVTFYILMLALLSLYSVTPQLITG